jgi:hypothetical protein
MYPFLNLTLGYADDLTASTKHKDSAITTSNLQTMCNVIASICLDLKMSLNTSKTIFILFSKKTVTPSSLNLLINITSIFRPRRHLFLVSRSIAE